MIFSWRRAQAIGESYDSIIKTIDAFSHLAKASNDKECLNFLNADVKPLIQTFNQAYLDDDKPTNAMVELFKVTDYCLAKAKSVYETKCKETFHKTLLDLLLKFIKKNY